MSIEQLGKRGLFDRVKELYRNFRLFAVFAVGSFYCWEAWWFAEYTDRHLGLYPETAFLAALWFTVMALTSFLILGWNLRQLHRYCEEIRKVTKDES